MTDLHFFSSPIGLGHVTRDIAIAENLESPPRFITGKSAARLLRQAGFDVDDPYSPPTFKVRDGALTDSTRWLWNYYNYYKQCKEISNKIINSDSPRLVISDEDFASLAVAQKMGIPTVLITDILETHFTKGFASFVERKMNKSMRKIIDGCDLVIIPEDGNDDRNIRRVGPIVRHTTSSRDELRKRFSFDKRTILISTGGTDAGRFLIEKSLDAISKIQSGVDVVVAPGPVLNMQLGDSIRNIGFVENLHEHIFASDLIISLAGKSTIDEAHAYGTPGIFIPIKDHFEQEDNARTEGFSFEDIYRLDEMILEKFAQERCPVTDGAAHTAGRLIRELL